MSILKELVNHLVEREHSQRNHWYDSSEVASVAAVHLFRRFRRFLQPEATTAMFEVSIDVPHPLKDDTVRATITTMTL